MRQPAIDDHAPHHAWNLLLGSITAEDLVHFGKCGFELPDSLGIGEARWRVGIAGEERRGRQEAHSKEAEQGDESHVG
jgi:hypothetical protein